MKILLVLGSTLLFSPIVFGQEQSPPAPSNSPAPHPQTSLTKLKTRVILVDKDLNQKPVPHFTLALLPKDPPGAPVTIKTGLDGSAETTLLPGNYKLSTPEPVEFQGKRYQWEMEIIIAGQDFVLELSNDNAKASDIQATAPVRKIDELTTFFQRYQNAIVTVWSEIGHGTGFFVDKTGLIITNQHVIGPSTLISAQFDTKRKVSATLLAFNAEKDVAVLWINAAAFPEMVTVPVAKSEAGHETAVEGEKVFTIGSPLSQRKILTSGTVSKVEARAIISDININPGNSGGPLFNSIGEVVGITTFGEHERSGP